MTQHLDARQRAMLQEMGIALPVLPARATKAATAPKPPAARAAEPAPDTPALPPPHAPIPQPAPTQATAAPPPAREAPVAAPAHALGEVLLAAPVAPYAPADASAGQNGGWLVLLECAQPAEPLAGDAGRLLDNMLRAMGLHHQPVTRVAALVPPGQLPAGASSGISLTAVLAQLRPRMVLVLGLGAARAVLGSRELLAHLRSQVHRLADGTPAAVSHDPSYLLHAPEAKAAAWLDLCRALAFASARPGDTDRPGPAPS